MKSIFAIVLLTSFSALACPNLDGHFVCNLEDSLNVEHVEIQSLENGYSVKSMEINKAGDRVTQSNVWELGKSTETVVEDGLTLTIEREVSCQQNSLQIVTDLYVEEYDLNFNVNLKYKLNDEGNLVFEQSGSLNQSFECKPK